MRERLLNIMTKNHEGTSRDYLARMFDDKVACSIVSRRFESEYWDGSRRYGYGGYKYIEGRWTKVAEDLIEAFDLTAESRVLDVGCGKGFLLAEIKKFLPDITVVGLDISKHALADSHVEVSDCLYEFDARNDLVFEDNYFHLLLSLNVLHNFRVHELAGILREFKRVSHDQFVCVESYRDVNELFNLQCWALTAESFFTPDEWKFIFDTFGFDGYYEFIFFNDK